MTKDSKMWALSLIVKPDGTLIPSLNVTAMDGIRSALKLKETGDIRKALAVRNPKVSPHLSLLIVGTWLWSGDWFLRKL